MDVLTVAEVFEIEGRGTAVVFTVDPNPWWQIDSYTVRVSTPDGEQFEATAFVELVRRAGKESMALLFRDSAATDIPVKSLVARTEVVQGKRR